MFKQMLSVALASIWFSTAFALPIEHESSFDDSFLPTDCYVFTDNTSEQAHWIVPYQPLEFTPASVLSFELNEASDKVYTMDILDFSDVSIQLPKVYLFNGNFRDKLEKGVLKELDLAQDWSINFGVNGFNLLSPTGNFSRFNLCSHISTRAGLDISKKVTFLFGPALNLFISNEISTSASLNDLFFVSRSQSLQFSQSLPTIFGWLGADVGFRIRF